MGRQLASRKDRRAHDMDIGHSIDVVHVVAVVDGSGKKRVLRLRHVDLCRRKSVPGNRRGTSTHGILRNLDTAEGLLDVMIFNRAQSLECYRSQHFVKEEIVV